MGPFHPPLFLLLYLLPLLQLLYGSRELALEKQVLLLLPQMLLELLPPTIMNLLLLPTIFIAFGRGAFDGYHLCSVWLSPFATLLSLPLPFLFVNPACFYLSLGFACPFAWLFCFLLLFLCFSKLPPLDLLMFELLLKFLQPVCSWI